jgi:hypothetical protein
MHEEHRAVAAVHNKSAFGFQLLKAARENEIRGSGVHGRLLQRTFGGSTIQLGPPYNVNSVCNVPPFLCRAETLNYFDGQHYFDGQRSCLFAPPSGSAGRLRGGLLLPPLTTGHR